MLKDFPGRKPDEHVIMIIRKHPIVFVSRVFVFLMITVLPLILFFYFWSKGYPIDSGTLMGVSGYLIALMYLLISLMTLLISWLDEEFDLFILTDHRLIDITQIGFLKREVAATPLSQIQDSTGDIQGLFGTILNYGEIKVRTAAGKGTNFSLDRVPDPDILARKILNYAHKSKEMHGQIDHEEMAPDNVEAEDGLQNI